MSDNICLCLPMTDNSKNGCCIFTKMSFLGKNQERTLLREIFNCCYNQKLFCQFIALHSTIGECNLYNNCSIHNGETCLMCTSQRLTEHMATIESINIYSTQTCSRFSHKVITLTETLTAPSAASAWTAPMREITGIEVSAFTFSDTS